MIRSYVHGYDPRENVRLQDQAATLEDLLHGDTAYPAGSRVLEAGCGVGAQTVLLAARSPQAEITSIDVSETSVAQARQAVAAAGFDNVALRQADIFHLPFAPGSFDHVFLCFVLHPPHLRRHGRGCGGGGPARRVDAPGGLGSRSPGAPALRGAGRGVLLHVLQGQRTAAAQGVPMLAAGTVRAVDCAPASCGSSRSAATTIARAHWRKLRFATSRMVRMPNARASRSASLPVTRVVRGRGRRGRQGAGCPGGGYRGRPC